jgi:hypothetical protein
MILNIRSEWSIHTRSAGGESKQHGQRIRKDSGRTLAWKPGQGVKSVRQYFALSCVKSPKDVRSGVSIDKPNLSRDQEREPNDTRQN